MHGGSVTATSEGPGKGSEFAVRLPAPRAAAGRASRRAATAARRPAGRPRDPRRRRQRGHGPRDGPAPEAPRATRSRIAHDGPTAHRGGRGSTGPSSSSSTSACPAWTATRSPRGSGEEECCKDAVIIAVSGYGQEEARRRSREAGFDHHLVKPVDYDRLVALVRAPVLNGVPRSASVREVLRVTPPLVLVPSLTPLVPGAAAPPLRKARSDAKGRSLPCEGAPSLDAKLQAPDRNGRLESPGLPP